MRADLPPEVLLARLLATSIILPPGCYHWAGANNGRYGYIRLGARVRRVHIVAWEALHGRPAPPVLHHRCTDPLCWRDEHLEPLQSQREHYLVDWRMQAALRLQHRHMQAIRLERERSMSGKPGARHHTADEPRATAPDGTSCRPVATPCTLHAVPIPDHPYLQAVCPQCGAHDTLVWPWLCYHCGWRSPQEERIAV